MIAHRGVHKDARDENTARAFEDALQCVDGFECDVRLSSDGVPMVVHDHTLLRTHGIDRRVQDASMTELQSLNIPRVKDIAKCVSRRRSLKKNCLRFESGP